MDQRPGKNVAKELRRQLLTLQTVGLSSSNPKRTSIGFNFFTTKLLPLLAAVLCSLLPPKVVYSETSEAESPRF